MGGDRDIEIEGRVIGESTKITLTVKTAIWVISILIFIFSTAFTIAYFDVKNDVKSYKEKIDKDKDDFVKKIEENINSKLDKQRDKDEEFIKAIEEIRGNIRLLLDRTQDLREVNTNGVNTINSNTPSNTPPTSSTRNR
jgi:hypothetical protein